MRRFTTRTALLAAAALLFGAVPGAAQATVEGVKLTTRALELEIGGRVQTLFNTTTVDSEPDAQWLLRRIRLEAKVKINDVVSGKVQPDFAGDRVSVKDAYLKLDLDPAVQVLAGKAYRPFSLLEQTSSTRMLPIERGLRIRGVEGFDQYALVNELGYSDRDIGLQLMGSPAGAPMGLSYAVGLFGGPAQGRTGNESPFQYAARATVRPADGVQLGAGWSSRPFARGGAGALPLEVERGNAFEVDLELGSFSPGAHLLAEVAFGDVTPFEQSDFVGAQAWLGYRTGALGRVVSLVEPMLRVSYGDVDGGALDGRGGTLVTPGLNVFFGGLNRVQVNYDLWSPSGDQQSEGSFKAMFQLAF